MKCLSKIEHVAIPNDIVVSLSKIYRRIGNNDYYIKSLGNDINKVIELTVEKDAYYLAKILKLELSESRMRLIITKDSSPRTKEEKTLYNIKEILQSIQQKYQNLRLQSNDLYNIINYVYSHYPKIKFSMSEANRSVLQSQGMKSKRLVLDQMNDIVEKLLRKNGCERINLYLHYFVDLVNLKPFESRNDTLSLLILYQLILSSDLNAFKYVSFFELLYKNYDDFQMELSKASANWNEGYSQTNEFIRFLLKTFETAYTSTDRIIKDYNFDRINKKYENIESVILSMQSIFTKEDIRKEYPYVSESTINRALSTLRDQGYIKPLGKGRSAKWTKC